MDTAKKYFLVIEERGWAMLNNLSAMDDCCGAKTTAILSGPARIELRIQDWKKRTDEGAGIPHFVFTWQEKHIFAMVPPMMEDLVGFPQHELQELLEKYSVKTRFEEAE